jgi:peptidoglycan/xylan/chitin deacetylase (PgdA/CDA1 family)
LHRLLREENRDSREAVLSDLRRQVGAPDSTACESHRTLSASELRDLAQEDLFEVGAHAVDHLVLRHLPAEEQARQIRESKSQLEGILSRPVESFAYPYGSEWDVSPVTVDLVQQEGFQRACANVPGQVRRDSNPYWLPRCLVRDWGEAEFRQRLHGFFVPHRVARPVSA